jgi:hypothetical protein
VAPTSTSNPYTVEEAAVFSAASPTESTANVGKAVLGKVCLFQVLVFFVLLVDTVCGVEAESYNPEMMIQKLPEMQKVSLALQLKRNEETLEYNVLKLSKPYMERLRESKLF